MVRAEVVIVKRAARLHKAVSGLTKPLMGDAPMVESP